MLEAGGTWGAGWKERAKDYLITMIVWRREEGHARAPFHNDYRRLQCKLKLHKDFFVSYYLFLNIFFVPYTVRTVGGYGTMYPGTVLHNVVCVVLSI